VIPLTSITGNTRRRKVWVIPLPITPSAAVGALVSSNYTITYNTAPLFSINTAKALSITATATGKVFARQIPSLTYTVTGGLGIAGDSITSINTETRAAGESVGTLPFHQPLLVLVSNYTITYNTPALFSIITAKALEHHRHCHRQGLWSGRSIPHLHRHWT
jgi:hypothetical protein